MRRFNLITFSTLLIWFFAMSHCLAECVSHIDVNHSKSTIPIADHHHHHDDSGSDSSHRDHSDNATPCEISSVIVSDNFTGIASSTSTFDISTPDHLPIIEYTLCSSGKFSYQINESSKHTIHRVLLLVGPNPPPYSI